MYHTTQTHNLKTSYLFELVTLDDLDLTQGHKMLRTVLRNIPDVIHLVPSALFHSDTAGWPGEVSNDR